MTNTPQQPPAGWYPDPAGSNADRYWDGIAWSQATRDKPAPVDITPEASPGGYARPQHGMANDPNALRVATFGRRVAGFLIDFLLVYVLGSLILQVTGLALRADGESTRWLNELLAWSEDPTSSIPLPSAAFWTATLLSIAVRVSLYAIYRIILLGTLSATLGQLAMGLKTVRLGEDATAKLGWGTAVVRGLAGAFLYQDLVIGFINGIFAASTTNKQTLSDMISRTQVLITR